MNLLSIVIPVKDERGNLRALVSRLRDSLGYCGPWEAIFVDDGSTDGTFAELISLANEDSRIKVVRLRRNFGQSAAMQAGFDHAAGDVIATLDGDGQNDPSDLPLMLDKLDDGFDVVLGRRADRKDTFLLRTLPSVCANWLIRRITGVPFRDFGCTLRVMRREVVDGMNLYGEMHRFITAFAVQSGARVTQVPVRHHSRKAGQSKYGLSRTLRVMLDLITVKFLASYQTRPMHLFGGVGFGLMLFGFLSLFGTMMMKFNGIDMTGNPLLLLAVLLEVIGVQFVSLGLVGEVLTRVYFESQGKPPYTVRETLNFRNNSLSESNRQPVAA